MIILCHTYEWGAKASVGGKGFASLMSMFSKKNYICHMKESNVYTNASHYLGNGSSSKILAGNH